MPLTAFDGVDYVALGHLHGRQRMSETVRYSGSPLAYSFSEADQVKGSWLVTLGSESWSSCPPRCPAPSAACAATWRTCSPHRATPASKSTGSRSCSPTRSAPNPPWNGCAPASRTPSPSPSTPTAAQPAHQHVRLSGRPEADVALDFVREVRGEPAASDEEELLRRAIEASRVKETMA